MSDDKNVIFGGPDVENICVGCKSIGEVLLRQLPVNKDAVVLVDGVTGVELTYSNIIMQSIRLAECLKYAGLRSGDVIGICSENRLEFPTVLCAAFMIGVTIAPLNLTYTERELHHAVNLSHPKLLIGSPYSIEKAINVVKANSFIRELLIFGEESLNGLQTLQQFIKNSKAPVSSNFKSTDVNIDEHVALILCSSGTTGLPKGVQLTHANIMVAISQTEDGVFTLPSTKKEMCVLCVIPWFHAFGCLTLISMVTSGIKMVYLPKFDEFVFLTCIENYKTTLALMVPPLMVFLAKHPLVDNFDLSSLNCIICGAAPLSKELQQAVYNRLHIDVIRQGYGMSELTLSTLVQHGKFMKPGSVGGATAGVYVKVVDTETGKSLGPNKSGELCFKGSQIMKGYVGDKQSTSATIDKDGWLHTGDIGYYDDDKEFFIIDRLKELIKYKAFQVPPAEIEAILLTNPKVKDAAVIGIPDDSAGELPLGFIVKQPNVEITTEEILKYVSDRTSPAKRLHGGVRFVDEIPKNPSGKILRRELRDLVKTVKSKL